ncbi:uncharacterized protein B0I36DRAFT_111474 [Microdochium trichocladiopsis]|uniref:Uncharacterized protein n=1 Tax=Microdochium trichocladiopsis TaxID=1682393 RepID=A0A9P8YAD7_9PEZI|nr:uncharacterized protein B0I36DRAFT_111474 [Microdochium trichocladiopsis]KAH7033695.1 hypothetical protein B0I36DRAFT_111474 [Microdochium trichocladiopsis]
MSGSQPASTDINHPILPWPPLQLPASRWLPSSGLHCVARTAFPERPMVFVGPMVADGGAGSQCAKDPSVVEGPQKQRGWTRAYCVQVAVPMLASRAIAVSGRSIAWWTSRNDSPAGPTGPAPGLPLAPWGVLLRHLAFQICCRHATKTDTHGLRSTRIDVE